MHIDNIVLLYFERFGQWLQKNICGEWSCFWIARRCNDIFFLSGLLTLLFIAIHIPFPRNMVAVLFFSWIPLLAIGMYWFISWKQEDALWSIKKGFGNPLKITLAGTRILFLFTLLLSWSSLIVHIAFQNSLETYSISTSIRVAHHFLIFCFYFISCSPLPPCMSKVREWIQYVLRSQSILAQNQLPSLPS